MGPKSMYEIICYVGIALFGLLMGYSFSAYIKLRRMALLLRWESQQIELHRREELVDAMIRDQRGMHLG